MNKLEYRVSAILSQREFLAIEKFAEDIYTNPDLVSACKKLKESYTCGVEWNYTEVTPEEKAELSAIMSMED